MAMCACVYVLSHQIAQMLVISFKQVSLELQHGRLTFSKKIENKSMNRLRSENL